MSGVTVKELMSSFRVSRFDSRMLIWPHKYLLFDGAGSGQGSRIQFSELEETPNSKITSLSGSFVNLHA